MEAAKEAVEHFCESKHRIHKIKLLLADAKMADAIPLLGLDEQTIEINVTPDRGYSFSVRGVAREYSHSTGQVLRDPAAS